MIKIKIKKKLLKESLESNEFPTSDGWSHPYYWSPENIESYKNGTRYPLKFDFELFYRAAYKEGIHNTANILVVDLEPYSQYRNKEHTTFSKGFSDMYLAFQSAERQVRVQEDLFLLAHMECTVLILESLTKKKQETRG